MTATEELAGLRQAVRDAEAGVAVAEAEARRMDGAAERAERSLAAYHEAVGGGDRERDHELEGRLTVEVQRLRGEMSEQVIQGGGAFRVHAPSHARLAGARRALEDRRQIVERFVRSRRDDLAVELVQRARDLAGRYTPIAAEVEGLEREFASLRREWTPLLAALGLPADEVPQSPASRGRFTVPVTPPAPFSLLDLDELSAPVRAQVEAAGGRA